MPDGPSDGRYTHGHHESVLRSHRWRTAHNSAAYLLERLTPGDSVLDIGCGPGTITADLAALVAPGHVVALDRSPDIVDEAVALASDRGLDNVTGHVGDVHSIEFPDAHLDVVHAHQVLQHVADPVAALAEMARVVRPGGVVAARDADYGAMCWYPADPRLDRWMATYQSVARRNGGEPDAGRRLLAWANRAGLPNPVASASTWCFSTLEDRRWWGGLWADRMLHSTLAAQAVELGIAGADELAEYGAAFREWAEHPDGWFLVPHGEILATLAE